VVEDLLHRVRLVDDGDHAHATVAARALEHVDGEYDAE
jgi:hypothetical protein